MWIGYLIMITTPESYVKVANVRQAVILNRTTVYASPRRPVRLGFSLRLALRIIPIISFSFQIKYLLQAIQCQTSPRYSILKYGEPGKEGLLDFAGDGGFLYHLSSTLLFRQADLDSCQAVGIIPASPEASQQGSIALLWPLFKSLCLSQFLETLSCAIEGRHVFTETGMSLFEHSLAFAEAEAMISNRLGLSPFGSLKHGQSKFSVDEGVISDTTKTFPKSMIFERVNTTPEVLLVGLISSLNHVTSQILGVLNMQHRFRLINTGIWGLCFVASFVWGFFAYAAKEGGEAIILRFPTVCIVGFIPHFLILMGTCVCAFVYLLALVLSVLSPPEGMTASRPVWQRFQAAHQNLQATSQISNIRLNMHEDFYTMLFKVGFRVLTVASEAVYLNEGRKINIARGTWLEEQRMQEIEDSENIVHHLRYDIPAEIASGVILDESPHQQSISGSIARRGYGLEKTTKILKSGSRRANPAMGADGVGALQRSGRYLMARELFIGIFKLLGRAVSLFLVKLCDAAGISRRPRWLTGGKLKHKSPMVQGVDLQESQPGSLEFWLLSDEGVLSLPEDDNVDVEAETKKRIQIASDQWGDDEERTLDSTLYGWWALGGWWGERDESGNYQAALRDDDDTSVISTTYTVSTSSHDGEVGWETDDDGDDGHQTPTQRRPYPRSRSSSPSMDIAIDPSHLARLLAPKDLADRQEAQMLAHHLASDHITTRAAYRHAQAFEKAHVLTSTRQRPPGFPPGKLNPVEETELLEHLLISRRAAAAATASSVPDATSGAWQTGGEGLGAGGPQCVICQSSPRTVLAWPCRCLSLCEECRVSLAMNNFATCVCCRQEVVGFSRLFVP